MVGELQSVRIQIEFSNKDGFIVGPGRYAIILDPDYFEDSSRTYEGMIPDSIVIFTIDNSSFGRGGLANEASRTISLIDGHGNTVSTYTYHGGNPAGFSDKKSFLLAGIARRIGHERKCTTARRGFATV